jgi:hypothetical protein
MSKVEVNEIDKQTGSTLTLGGSGTAVTLHASATQSGFGSTGGISWQTSIKTTDFTAVSNEGYFVNTSGGSNITVTLPASPSAGNVVAIKDYARTFGTNKVILARNGSNMDGNAANTNLKTDGQSVILVFMDSTKGWSFINEDTTTQGGAAFVAATGGNTTATCGDFKIHTFTSPGTFCVSSAGNAAGSNTVSYLVVAGGGGGSGHYGGGGGAGGFREGLGLNDSYTGSPLRAPTGVPVTATGFPITVGGGGAGGSKVNCGSGVGTTGSNSIFSTITSAGGGGGANGSAGPNVHADGLNGGSGGGAGTVPGGSSGCVGAGNTPPVSPAQGTNGGTGSRCSSTHTHGGGGGGATEVGQNAGGCSQGASDFGRGGNGATSSINGTPTARAGGGGGGVNSTPNTPTGGSGGGGNGGSPANTSSPTVQGTINTGGGGGGINGNNPMPAGGTGGSGIVIIRYKFQ